MIYGQNSRRVGILPSLSSSSSEYRSQVESDSSADIDACGTDLLDVPRVQRQPPLTLNETSNVVVLLHHLPATVDILAIDDIDDSGSNREKEPFKEYKGVICSRYSEPT